MARCAMEIQQELLENIDSQCKTENHRNFLFLILQNALVSEDCSRVN